MNLRQPTKEHSSLCRYYRYPDMLCLISEHLHSQTILQRCCGPANFMETLKNENWNLHFDGKHIRKTEHQVVVLKKEIEKLN